MEPNQHSPSPSSPARGVNLSQGSVSAKEFNSFSSSLDRSRGMEDVTLQQLATAKETFTDLEVAYKNFKHEMEIVKEEHQREVGKLNAQIENHAKQKSSLEEQLRICKSEARKFQEELVVVKRNLAERDWEKETMSRELASHNTLIDKLRGERELLEGTIASLNQEIATSRMPVSTPPDRAGEDDKELALARQEVARMEADYKYALEEKEGLQAEIADMQNELADMQTNCEKMQREVHFSNKANNMKVSKLEVQIQNLTKQRDHMRNQLDESKGEQRKHKETISFLQRNVIDAEQKTETLKEELNLKSKQVEKLESVNRSQEIKVEEVRQECSRQQASLEMYSRQRSSFDSDIRAFESSISELEKSLQMTKNEKDNVHRELYSSTSKLVTIQESYQKARERSLELEQRVTTLKEGIAQLESDLVNERSKSFHIESAYNELRVEVDELSVKLEKADMKISALESDYDACIHERDDYKDTSSLSERKIFELKSLLQKSEDANNELDERFSAIKGQTWKLEGQFESVTKQKKLLKIELDEERSKVSKLNKELLAAQSRHNEYQRNVEWLKRDTASKDKIIEDMRASLSSAEQRIESFYEETDKLQARIEAVEDEKRELHEETLSAQKRTKEVEAEHVLITDEKEKLHSEIQAFYKRISEMQTSYNICEREKHDFQQQGMVLQHKVNKLEEDLQESIKRISSFELQMQELSSENRKSGEAVALYKGQSTEHQGTCEELRQLGIEREALIEQLREKNAVLNAEAGLCRTELSHYKSLCEEFEKENMSMQNELKAKQDEWSRLNATYETNLKKKEQLEYELSIVEKKVASMEVQSRKSQDKGNRKELDLERAKTAGLEKELSSLKMKFKLIESQSEVNQKDLHGVLLEMEQAEEKISSLTLEVDRITAEKSDESKRALLAENKCSELENEIRTCLHSKEKAEENVSVMGTRIAKYESQIQTLQKQKASMKEHLDIVNNDLTKQKEEIMCWESKVIESKKVNETLNSVISKKESLVQELEMNVGNTETDLKALRQEMISLKVHCEGMEADKTEDKQTISSFQEKVKGYEQELDSLQETRMALEQDIHTAKFRTTTLERQLQAALKDKEHYKSEHHNFQTTVRNVKEENLTLHNHLREKERRCEAYVADMKEKENELVKMRSSNVAIKRELLEVREDLEKMRYNFENSQHMVQELETSLSEANDSISKLDLSIENLHQEKSEDTSEEKCFEVEALLKKSQEKEQSLKQEIAMLKTRIGEMGTKLKSEQHKNIEQNQEMNTLQRKIQDSEIILERYEREKRNLKEELLQANSRVSDLEVKYDYESQERVSIEKQLQETRGRTTTNREKLLKTEQQAIEQRLAFEFSQKELKERDNFTSQLQASKKILEEQIESLKESLVQSREMCERMKGEQDKLQRDVLGQCSAIADSEARVQKISIERDRIQTVNHSYMSEISSLEQQVAEMGREKEQLLSKVDEWKQSCSKHRESEVNSQNKITELESKINSLMTQIAKKDNFVQELNDENAFMGKEIESLRRSLQRIEGDYNSALERKREIESQCRSMAENRLSVSSNECDQLEKDVSVLRRHVAELEADYKASREKEEELQRRLAVADSETAKLESQYSAVADQKVKLKHKMDALQKENVSIKESQQNSLFQIESFKEDVQECSSRIAQRDAQVGQLTRAKDLLERQLQQKDALLTTWENELLQTQRKLQEFQIVQEHKSKAKKGEETVLQHLTVEKNALEKDASVLRQELSVFQRSLNVAIKEKNDAQKELFDFKKQLTQCEIRLKSREQENEELHKELVTWQHKTSRLEEDWIQNLNLKPRLTRSASEENTTEKKDSRQGYSITKNDRSLSESCTDHQRSNLMEKDNAIKEQERTIKILKAEIRSYKLELRWYKEDNENTVSNKVAHFETIKSELEGEKQRCLNECISLKKKQSELTSQIDALQFEKSQMHMEILALRKKFIDVQCNPTTEGRTAETEKSPANISLEKLQFEYESSLRERDACTSEMGKLRKMLAQKAAECAEAQQRKEELQYEVSCRSRRTEELEILVQNFQDQDNSKRDELSAWQSQTSSLKEELATLQDRNFALKSFSAQCEEKLRKLREEHGIAQQKLVRTEGKLCTSEQRLAIQQKELKKAHERNSDTDSAYELMAESNNETSKETWTSKTKAISLEEVIHTQSKRQAQLEDFLKEMEGRNENLNEQVSRLQAKLWEREQEYDITRKEHSERKFMVDRINNEKVFLEKEIDALKTNLTSVRDNYEKAIAERRDLFSQVQELQLRATEWKTNLNLVKEENDKMKSELSNLQRSYSAVKLSYEAMKTENQACRSPESPYEVYKAECNAELEQLRIEKDHLNGVIGSLNTKYSSISKSYEFVQLVKRDLEQKLDVLQTTVLNLEIAQSSASVENSKLQQQLDTSVLRAKELEYQTDLLRKEKQGMYVELRELQQKLLKIEADYEVMRTAKVRVENETEEWSHRFSSLEAAHKESETRENELQRNLFAAQRKASNLEYELKTTREKIDALTVSYKASEDLVISLREETIDLGRKSSETEASCDRNLKRSKELEHHNSFLERTLSSQELQMKDLCRERDALLNKLIETETQSEETRSQLEKRVQTLGRENNKNKEMVETLTARIEILQKEIESLKEEILSKDTSSSKYRAKIKKLESELRETTDKSVISVNLCKEKENFIRQLENKVREVNMKFDDVHKEKEFLIHKRNHMESELRTARERINEFENRSVIEARAEKEFIVLKAKHFQLEKEYDRVSQERKILEIDAEVRRKALEEKNEQISKLERQVREVEFYKTKSEELSNTRATLNREKLFLENEARLAREKALECETRLEMEKKRLENELNGLGEKYAELERKYNELVEAKQKLEEITEIRVRSETMQKEESVYKLERDIRGLKSENEYYEKAEDKKYASINELRRKISRLETENEYLRKHIFIAVESYDKAEKKLKRIQSVEYEPVVTHQIRQAIREASGRNRCVSLDSSTASLSLSHLSISNPCVDRAGPKLGRSPTMSSTPRPVDFSTTETGDTQRIRRTSSIGRNAVNKMPRKSSSMRMSKDIAKSPSRKTSEDSFTGFESVFSSPSNSLGGSARKQDESPGGTRVNTAFPFGSSGSVSSVPWS